jgi:hypothetical protein
MSLSDTVENEMCQDFLTRHPALWLAMSRADPGEDGSGIDEPSVDDGYVRQLVGDVTITGNQITIDESIQFPVSTGDQGTLTYAVLFDAEDGGVYLGCDAIVPTPCPVKTIVVVSDGTVILRMD